jgi:predicted nucleic acid-binding protein
VPDKYKKPCFDSSVFLGKLKQEICHGIKREVVFDWLWKQAQTNEFEVYISALTLAEVYKTKRINSDGQIEVVELGEHYDEFLDLINEPFVTVVEVDRETSLTAHALCRKYNLWPGDGIQLASALRAECDVFVAWDIPLIGKKHDDCRIEEPCIYHRDLFYRGEENATPEEIAAYEAKNQRRAKPLAAPPVAIPVEVEGGGNGLIEGQAQAAEAIQPAPSEGLDTQGKEGT